MKNKELKDTNTLPFYTVFNDLVYVDIENRVVYDLSTGLAVGYVTPTYNNIIITLSPPAMTDDDFQSLSIDIDKYFNDFHVVIKYHTIYYKVAAGYVRIGSKETSGTATLSIPRIAPEEIEDQS